MTSYYGKGLYGRELYSRSGWDDMAGDLRPVVTFAATMVRDPSFQGGFTVTVTFASSEVIFGPLWGETVLCPDPGWQELELCNG
jgi:hypothetical protein